MTAFEDSGEVMQNFVQNRMMQPCMHRLDVMFFLPSQSLFFSLRFVVRVNSKFHVPKLSFILPHFCWFAISDPFYIFKIYLEFDKS